MTYVLLNRLTTKQGERDRVVQNLIESGKLFDENAACLLYLVAEPADDPNHIWVVDLWTSEEEHTKALQAPELQVHVAKTVPLLEGMPEQIELRVRGGKGLPDITHPQTSLRTDAPEASREPSDPHPP